MGRQCKGCWKARTAWLPARPADVAASAETVRMASDGMALSRRNIYERKVILLMRGDKSHHIIRGKNRNSPQAGLLRDRLYQCFESLMVEAAHHDLDIWPVHSLFISISEMNILRWLAEAQRQLGIRTCDIADRRFLARVKAGADALREVGLMLPSQTLYIHSRDGGRYAAGEQRAGLSL